LLDPLPGERRAELLARDHLVAEAVDDRPNVAAAADERQGADAG